MGVGKPEPAARAHQRLGVELLVVREVRCQDHRDVERSVDQGLLEGRTGGFVELDADAGVAAHEAGMVRRHEVSGDGIGQPDAHLAREGGAVRARRTRRLFHCRHDVARMLEKARAFRRQSDAVRMPLEQPRRQRLLELADRRGDCRLRDVQRHRSLGKLSGLGGRDEIADLLQRERQCCLPALRPWLSSWWQRSALI